MQLHHQKHHATYVNNLNQAEEKSQEALAKGRSETMHTPNNHHLGDLKTAISLQGALKFNGGGHINHCIFWTNLCKEATEPSAQLTEAIKRDFGSLQNLQVNLPVICPTTMQLYSLGPSECGSSRRPRIG